MLHARPVIKAQHQPNILRHRELGSTPQLGPLEIQDKHTHNPQCAQTAQKTNTPPNPQIDKQRPGKNNTPARQRRPTEIIGRKKRRRILRIRQRHIDKNALKHDKNASPIDGDPNHRHNPVDIRTRRPREEEQADGRAEDGEECGLQPGFLCAQAVLLNVGVEPEVEVGDVSCHAD